MSLRAVLGGLSAAILLSCLWSLYLLRTSMVKSERGGWFALPNEGLFSGGVSRSASDRVLVLYAYFENEANDYKTNAEFFMAVGMAPSEQALVDYVFVVSGAHTLDLRGLRTRADVLIVERDNGCFDFGSHGDGLAAARKWRGRTDIYRFFVFVNSSVRGPFMPVYSAWGMHWTMAFTDRLSDVIKLVGTTINCQMHPHVQSMVWATDQVGLDVISREGVFQCAKLKSMLDAIKNAEVGTSLAIFKAGYSIDCLLYRYARVNWRDAWMEKIPCNARENPTLTARNDGVSVHPFETVFVKAKLALRSVYYPTVEKLTAFTLRPDIGSNEYKSKRYQEIREAVRATETETAERCELIFDSQYYAGMNNDIWQAHGLGLNAHEELLGHWMRGGFAEPRYYRWKVVDEGKRLAAGCSELLTPRMLSFPYPE